MARQRKNKTHEAHNIQKQPRPVSVRRKQHFPSPAHKPKRGIFPRACVYMGWGGGAVRMPLLLRTTKALLIYRESPPVLLIVGHTRTTSSIHSTEYPKLQLVLHGNPGKLQLLHGNPGNSAVDCGPPPSLSDESSCGGQQTTQPKPNHALSLHATPSTQQGRDTRLSLSLSK